MSDDDNDLEEVIEDDDLDEDLDEDALEVADDDTDDLVVDDADLDADIDVEVELVADPEVPVAPAEPATPKRAKTGEDDEEEEGLDLDEELHPDDVEAPLDALLQERTAAATLEDDEEEVEEEEVDADAPGDVPTKIVPRRPGEFLCSSCFLVLPRNQLADEGRMLCRDCA